MDWYEPEVQSLERTLAQQPQPEHPAVLYGSSSFRMWDTAAQDLRSPRILNLAFGGSTLQACAHFFDRLVPGVAPASLLVYAGDNDLGDGRSPEDVRAAFRELAAKVRRTLDGIPFGFVSIKPSPARLGLLDRIQRANQYVKDDIEAQPGGYYVDVFGPMLLASGTPRPELFLEDGLHLSRAGYALWTGLLLPYRNRIVTPVSSGGNNGSLSSKQDEP